MATELGVAYLSIAASTSQLSSDIKKSLGDAQSEADRSGKQSGGLFAGGFKGAIGVLGALGAAAQIAGFFRDANAEARESQKVNALTESIIKSTGGAAKITAGQIGELATSISNKTGIDDEAIQSSANLLLTFKNVKNELGAGNDVFNRATMAAQDLAAAGFGSADGAAKMLGKALNDPIKGMGALGRAGVTFTQQQKEQVKAMVASGDVLGAQKLIMAEVESQVGGAAEASATAAEKIAVKWGNLKEAFGAAFVIPAIDWLAEKLSPVVDWLTAQIPKVQAFFASFTQMGGGEATGALAGIIGMFSPLSLLLKAVAPILPQVAAAFGQLGGQLASALLPVLGQLAPIVGQVVQVLAGGLQTVILALLPVITQLASAVLPVFAQVIAAIVPVFMQLVQAVLPLVPILANLVASLLPPLMAAIQALVPAILPLVAAFMQIVQALLPIVGIFVQLIGSLIPPLMAVIQALLPPIVSLVSTIAGALVPIFEAVAAVISALLPIVAGLVQVIASIVGAVVPVIAIIAGGLIGVIGALIGWIGQAIAAVVNFVAGIVSAIGGLIKWVTDAWNGVVVFLAGVWRNISTAAQDAWTTLVSWIGGIPAKILSALGSLATLLYKAGTDLLTGLKNGATAAWETVKGWVSGIGKMVVDAVGNLGSTLLSAGRDLVEGLWSGISGGYSWITGKIRGWVGDVMAFIKKLFGIASPSKVMADEVGKWLPEGIGVGIEANTDAAIEPFRDLSLAAQEAAASATFAAGVGVSDFDRSTTQAAAVDLSAATIEQIVNGFISGARASARATVLYQRQGVYA